MAGNYRKSIAAIIVNKDKKVLMCEHVWIDDAWQFPQGGIEDGETSEETVLRELDEELGSKKFIILDKMPEPLKYQFPYYLKSKYHFEGQIQTFFLLFYYGEDKDIRFNNQERPEFKSFKWVDYNEPPLRVIYFKKISYLKALDHFRENVDKLDVKLLLNNVS